MCEKRFVSGSFHMFLAHTHDTQQRSLTSARRALSFHGCGRSDERRLLWCVLRLKLLPPLLLLLV
jgi:hypothetical protein